MALVACISHPIRLSCRQSREIASNDCTSSVELPRALRKWVFAYRRVSDRGSGAYASSVRMAFPGARPPAGRNALPCKRSGEILADDNAYGSAGILFNLKFEMRASLVWGQVDHGFGKAGSGLPIKRKNLVPFGSQT